MNPAATEISGTPAHAGVPSFLSGAWHVRILSLVAALLLLSFLSPLRAQWLGDPDGERLIRQGIDHLYNIRFDSARSEFSRVIAAHPDHPAGHFFLAAVEWWRIMADFENTEHDDRFIELLDRVIELCDRRLDDDENDLAALFFKGGALGFQGRLYGNREDWIKAANSGRSALPIVQESYRIAPGNSDILFGTGIYNYYAAVVPEKYPFVKPLMLFFPDGDKEKGLEQLETASRNAKYADTEASYFLLQILYNFEKQYDRAYPIAGRLHSLYPRNPLFHRYVGRCQAVLNRWDLVGETFSEILGKVHEGELGFTRTVEREARYYLGLREMRRDNLGVALDHFYRADELCRTLDAEKFTGYMTMTNLKVGMIYDLQGKRDLALRQYEKVLDMNDFQSAHDLAERYKTAPYTQN
jgi:tetratricopeptide (TPR) repeat protein